MRWPFVLLIAYAVPAHAQSVRGIVSDASTHHVLFPVTVMNQTAKQATITDAKGRYDIPAHRGDVLVFTSIGYESAQRIYMTGDSVAVMNVSMVPKAYELEDMVIRPGKLSQYQLDSIDRATTYRIQLQRRHPPPLASPVSAFAELFSRKSKRIYAFQKDFAIEERQKYIHSVYTVTLVKAQTKLTGDSLMAFMHDNEMPYDFARTASPLELKMWVREAYRNWHPTSIPSAADTVK